MLALGAAAVVVLGGCGSSRSTQPARSGAAPASGYVAAADPRPSCVVRGAAARADRALAVARARYVKEANGSVIHTYLRQIAHDRVLIAALSAHKLDRARAQANRQLVRHVVRIRVTNGSRVLVDANSTSFDVAGSAMPLRGPAGRRLGRLAITVQDVIGFIKLGLRRGGANAVLVRARGGPMRTSLPALSAQKLPRRGCVRVGRRSYVVRSFTARGFIEGRLDVWILVAA